MKPRVYRVSGRLALAALVFVCAYPLVVWAQTTTPKRVVVLYWDNKDFPGNIRFEESFKTRLQLGQRQDIEYYPEYFEYSRFPEEKHITSFRDYLRAKYASRTVDVVVASADAPLDFLLDHRSDLFPNTPIIFVANNPPKPEALAPWPGATGVRYRNAYHETLELALRLHPHTEQVYVVSGTPQHDRRFERAVQAELFDIENIKIKYLTDLPLPELIATTKSLPPNSVILYVWQQGVNEQGKLLESYEVLSRIAPESSAPIYGFGTIVLGSGIVGGYLQGPEMNGAKAGEIVERILDGTQTKEIPVERAPRVPMFDWRELRRWRIPENSLPPDSVVRFKEFTFWELYRWRIAGVLTLTVVQSIFIAVLLVEQHRRRRATAALDRLNAELEERITARTAALNSKSRELEAFAYSVAHDLKAPLRGIHGYSHLLLEDHAANLDDEGRSFLRTIHGSTEEMGQLIDDLLEYSRLERREFQRGPIELGPLVKSLVEQKQREASAISIDFVVNVNGGDVLGDRNGLMQSLRNYLDNAVKFTGKVSHPRIEVGSEERAEHHLIWVRDNGVGFDMKYHDRIFNMFQRLNPGEEYPGTGIGLVIVRKAMQRMGGRAWAESEAGHGATFYLEIPR